MPAKILLVEDEEALGRTLCDYLEYQGHHCFWANRAQKARVLFSHHTPDVVLMDIGLPDGDGIDLALSFRREKQKTRILFLSAFNDPSLRLKGLEGGAEDYITKPFALKELLLRLQRILKDPLGDTIRHGRLEISFSRYELRDAQGNLIHLGKKSLEILRFLYGHRGCPVDREELIREVWGDDKYPTNRTVDNYIVGLRKWCDTDPDKSLEIQSVRGVGYKLNISK